MSQTGMVTVVRDGLVWTGGADPRLLPRHDVVIVEGVVAEIEQNYRGRVDEEVDAGGCIVVPGFINAHVHPGSSPRSRGLAEDAEVAEDGAYYHLTVPVQMIAGDVLDANDIAAITEWDAVAMLLGGATTIVGEYFGPIDHWIPIVRRLGFRCDLGATYPNRLGAIGFMKDGRIQSTDAGDVAADFEAALRMHQTHDGLLDGRLSVHLSPHGPDTVPEEVLRATKRKCADLGLRAHLHLAQHLAECRNIEARYGTSPVRYLHDIGFLGHDVMATHVTYVDDTDINLLAASGAHVVHCPYRKAKEGVTSPFHEFLGRGINVAIATDSFSHDLMLDLKLACLLGKIRSGSVARPNALEALSCVTHGAAKALGRRDLGTLEPGARGDLVVIALQSAFAAPVFDPLRALVYYGAAADIRHTLVDGAPVVRNGAVVGVDMGDLRRRTQEACDQLWSRAAERGVLPSGVRYTGCLCGQSS